MSGTFGSAIFLFTKYGVLLRRNPTMKGLILIPFYFWVTGSLIVMLLIWKGGDYEVNLTEAQIPGVIVAAGGGFAMLIAIFLVPWIYRVVIKEDWQLRAWHILQGPLLLRRGEVPPPPPDFQGAVRNFYDGHLTREELDARRARTAAAHAEDGDPEAQHENQTAEKTVTDAARSDNESNNNNNVDTTAEEPGHTKKAGLVGPKPDAPWYSAKYLWWGFKFLTLRGLDVDIVASQKTEGLLSGDLEEIHARGTHFDNRTEFLYTFLQVMTASSASFVHGANDVANAVGPYASIYQIWKDGVVPGPKSNVPIWILAFGGIGIAIGIWTYGYRIMANLGNRITLMSPARGFSMELGSVITIVIATRLRKSAPIWIPKDVFQDS
jgi:solute carrier family 20 (sodium-dependent phosphate transporter)